MPPVSQAQRAAMHAAAEGKSTVGIPKKVGQEFDAADPGGELPEHKGKKRKGGRHTAEQRRSAMYTHK